MFTHFSHEIANPYLLIPTAVLLISLAAIIIGCLSPSIPWRLLLTLRFFRYILLVFSAWYVFISPPMQIQDVLLPYESFWPSKSCNEKDVKASFQKELELVRAEIENRIGFENEWFQYKFLFLGGLITTVLGTAFLVERVSDSPKPTTEFLRSREFMLILGVGVLVEMVIDVYLRRNSMVIGQIGSWLAGYAEPFLLARPSAGGVVGWEQFLRLQAPHAGMHRSPTYAVFFWPSLHLPTLLCVAAYVRVYSILRRNPSEDMQPIDSFLYILIATTFVSFAVTSRVMPGSFELQTFIPSWGTEGWTEAWLAMIASGAAATLCVLEVWNLFLAREREEKGGTRLRASLGAAIPPKLGNKGDVLVDSMKVAEILAIGLRLPKRKPSRRRGRPRGRQGG